MDFFKPNTYSDFQHNLLKLINSKALTCHESKIKLEFLLTHYMCRIEFSFANHTSIIIPKLMSCVGWRCPTSLYLLQS